VTENINLAYRPKSYFAPLRLEEQLIAQVKSAVVRRKLEKLHTEGRLDELRALLKENGILKSSLKGLETIHPAFMGGNYLPGAVEGEIEIARIEIDSTTNDVTSLLAKQDEGRIQYWVVDEYDGETLTGPVEMTCDKPLTLGEMADFFLDAWNLIEVLKMNFEGNQEASLDFFIAKSKFYPDFDRLCRQRVMEAIPERDKEEDYENE
jgi:hypothetical protein